MSLSISSNNNYTRSTSHHQNLLVRRGRLQSRRGRYNPLRSVRQTDGLNTMSTYEEVFPFDELTESPAYVLANVREYLEAMGDMDTSLFTFTEVPLKGFICVKEVNGILYSSTGRYCALYKTKREAVEALFYEMHIRVGISDFSCDASADSENEPRLSNEELEHRIIEILRKHRFGVWNYVLPVLYTQQYRQQPPANFFNFVHNHPSIAISNVSSDRFIVELKTPISNNAFMDRQVPNALVTINSEVRGQICHVKNPCDFYFRSNDQMESLYVMEREIQQLYMSLNAPPVHSNLKESSFGVAPSAAGQMFSRIKVLQLRGTSEVLVRFIDHGSEEWVPSESVHFPTEKLLEKPCCVIRCSLHACKKDKEDGWEEAQMMLELTVGVLELRVITINKDICQVELWQNGESLRQVVLTRGWLKQVELPEPEDKWEMKLLAEQPNLVIAIRQRESNCAFLQCWPSSSVWRNSAAAGEFTGICCPDVNHEFFVKAIDLSESSWLSYHGGAIKDDDDSLEEKVLNMGQMDCAAETHTATLIYISSLSEMLIRIVSSDHGKNMERLCNFMSDKSNARPISADRGSLCCCSVKGAGGDEWLRGEVVEVSQVYKVFLIDVGEYYCCPAVCQLPLWFSHQPGIAKCVSLAGITPGEFADESSCVQLIRELLADSKFKVTLYPDAISSTGLISGCHYQVDIVLSDGQQLRNVLKFI